MNLINNSKCNLSHDKYYLEIGKTLNVPDAVANVWLKINGVNRFISPEDIEKEKEKAVKEALKEAAQAKAKTKTNKKK